MKVNKESLIYSGLKSKFGDYSFRLRFSLALWENGHGPGRANSTFQLPSIRCELLAAIHRATLDSPLVEESLPRSRHHQRLHMQVFLLPPRHSKALLQLLVSFLIKPNPPPPHILRRSTPHLIRQLAI
jgi:hypothetical protein